MFKPHSFRISCDVAIREFKRPEKLVNMLCG